MTTRGELKTVQTFATIGIGTLAITMLDNLTKIGVLWSTADPNLSALSYGIMFACVASLIIIFASVTNRMKISNRKVEIILSLISVSIIGVVFGTYIAPKLAEMLIPTQAIIYGKELYASIALDIAVISVVLSIVPYTIWRIWQK